MQSFALGVIRYFKQKKNNVLNIKLTTRNIIITSSRSSNIHVKSMIIASLSACNPCVARQAAFRGFKHTILCCPRCYRTFD